MNTWSDFIPIISFVLSNFIIPPTNTYRIDFANKYFKNKEYSIERNIHMQINPGEYMYMESFNTNRSVGYKFSLEKIIGKYEAIYSDAVASIQF